MASEKIFVNSAWAKKVPAKSPQGTPLNAGVNAFVSVDAALNKYPDDLGEKQVILLNKSTAVNNTKDDTDINYEYLASQEIDKDFAKNATTATSTVTAVGDLTLNYNEGAGADEATLGGFLNVNLSTKAGEDPSTLHTVLGGKNVVSHSYAANDVLVKEAATVKSVAAGSLNVSNSNVLVARGAFATVDDTEGFNIAEEVPAFSVNGTGTPSEVEFSYGADRLQMLSGYATVSLKNGSAAEELYGGTQTYAISSADGYNKNSELNRADKIYTLSTSTSGTLTADKSAIGRAAGYATATLSETNFIELNAFSVNVTEKSAYAMSKAVKYNNELEATKTVVSSTSKQVSTGKATISKVEEGGFVFGYNNVSIANSTVQDLEAGSFSTASSGNQATAQTISNQAVVDTVTTATTSTDNSVAIGTLNVKESAVGQVSGFSTVTGDKSTFGTITSFKENNTFKANSSTINEEEVVSGALKVSSNKVAIGKVTLKESSVDGDIKGFSSVTGTTVAIAEDIEKGWSKVTNQIDEHKSNELTGAQTIKHTSKVNTTAAGSVTLSKDSSVGGNVEGYSSVVAKDTTFGGDIEGGKALESTATNYAKTVKNDVVTEVYSFAEEDAGSATGKVDLTKSVVGGEISGFQTVTLKDVDGSAELDGETVKTTDSYKNTLVNDELIARTRKSTVAKSTSSTLTVTNSGEEEEFTAEKIAGFNKVTANYGVLGDIYRLAPAETESSSELSIYEEEEEEAAFPTDKEEFAVTYAKNDKKTAVKVTDKKTFTASGSVSLSDTAKAGVIDGYSSITLKANKDEEPITATSANGLSWSDSYSITTEKDADGNYISSAYNFVTNETPSLAFTAANAVLEAGVNGFKSANLSQTSVSAITAGRSSVRKDSYAANRKGDLYNGNEVTSRTRKAVGTVTMDKGSSVENGGIVGALKVVATGDDDYGVITINGGLTGSSNTERTTKAQSWGSTDVAVYNPGLVDAQNQEEPESYDVVLEDGTFDYARADVSSATKYTSSRVNTDTSKAVATLTKTVVNGDIDGYGTVTLVNSEINEGNVTAASSKTEIKVTYDKGILNQVEKYSDTVIGSFSAVNSTIVAEDFGGSISGFAAVTLANAEVSGDIVAGKSLDTWIGKGEGATYGDASEDIEWTHDLRRYAAGTLKAAYATIGGAVRFFKTASFAGDNEIHGGIYGVSGDKDAVTIEANSALTVMENAVIGHLDEEEEEFNVLDALTVNGTLRLAVADVEELEISVKKAAGKGMIAIQSDDYEDVKAYVVERFGSKFDIVNGGDEDAIKTIRTRAEEHSDDTQANATSVVSETKVNGWLSGTDENEMFKDSADWFTFSKEKGGWTANDYVVELIGSGDGNIQAELYNGSTLIDESDWREDEGSGFKLNTEFLAESGYSSVQLKLFVDDDVDPAAYSVSVARALA